MLLENEHLMATTWTHIFLKKEFGLSNYGLNDITSTKINAVPNYLASRLG